MAEIRVNAEQWNAIPGDEQNRIVAALREVGALNVEDQIIPDPSEAPFTEKTPFDLVGNPLKAKGMREAICKAACDAVAAQAVIWCTANTAGAGLVACLAAVEGVRQVCRRACE